MHAMICCIKRQVHDEDFFATANLVRLVVALAALAILFVRYILKIKHEYLCIG